MSPIVVLPCSQVKRDGSMPAQYLYAASSTFRLGLEAAQRLTDPWKIKVMSAKHGIIGLHYRIQTYNTTLDDPDAVGVAELRNGLNLLDQLRPVGSPVPRPPIVSLLPNRYHALFMEAFSDCEIVQVYAGCRGIGDQRHRLRLIIETGDLGNELVPPGRTLDANIA